MACFFLFSIFTGTVSFIRKLHPMTHIAFTPHRLFSDMHDPVPCGNGFVNVPTLTKRIYPLIHKHFYPQTANTSPAIWMNLAYLFS